MTLLRLFYCFICLLCLVAVFIHHSMHPFGQLSSLCSHPNPLNPPSSILPPPWLIRSPLIPSILPSPGENLSIFNPAASSSASCHTGATAISKPNMVVSHRGLVDLPFHSPSTLSCLHSLVTRLALSLLFQKFDPKYLKSPAVDNFPACNLILSVSFLLVFTPPPSTSPVFFPLHPTSQCHLQTLGFVKAALSKYCLI